MYDLVLRNEFEVFIKRWGPESSGKPDEFTPAKKFKADLEQLLKTQRERCVEAVPQVPFYGDSTDVDRRSTVDAILDVTP